MVGGGPGSVFDFTFNSLNNPISKIFSSSAPKYRVVFQGLSLEGICLTKSCPGMI